MEPLSTNLENVNSANSRSEGDLSEPGSRRSTTGTLPGDILVSAQGSA